LSSKKTPLYIHRAQTAAETVQQSTHLQFTSIGITDTIFNRAVVFLFYQWQCTLLQ